MLINRNSHKKSSEVSTKTRSTPASLSVIGQATKQTTVKINGLLLAKKLTLDYLKKNYLQTTTVLSTEKKRTYYLKYRFPLISTYTQSSYIDFLIHIHTIFLT